MIPTLTGLYFCFSLVVLHQWCIFCSKTSFTTINESMTEETTVNYSQFHSLSPESNIILYVEPVDYSYDEKNTSFVHPLVIMPAITNHTATIIFLHGWGDTGEGMERVLDKIRKPYMKIICPTAPVIPVTLRLGKKMHAWYDIMDIMDADIDKEGRRKAIAYVHHLIEKENKKGIPTERIIISGFSQGAELALLSGFAYHKKLGAIVSFSTWIAEADDDHFEEAFPNRNGANKDTPLYTNLGETDTTVAYTTRDDEKFISKSGEKHAISKSQFRELDSFFQKHVPEI